MYHVLQALLYRGLLVLQNIRRYPALITFSGGYNCRRWIDRHVSHKFPTADAIRSNVCVAGHFRTT